MTGIDPFEVLAVGLTIVAMYTGALIWITSRLAALSEKQVLDIGALRLELTTKVESLKESSIVGLESMKTEEGKRRHDLANQAQTAIMQLQSQVNQLRDGGATKAELTAVEARLTTAIGEVKIQITKMGDKLDVIPELKSEVSALVRQLRDAMGVKTVT
jgi:signal transduction histidine kinase